MNKSGPETCSNVVWYVPMPRRKWLDKNGSVAYISFQGAHHIQRARMQPGWPAGRLVSVCRQLTEFDCKPNERRLDDCNENDRQGGQQRGKSRVPEGNRQPTLSENLCYITF